jgi:hypothetical protein
MLAREMKKAAGAAFAYRSGFIRRLFANQPSVTLSSSTHQ